VEEAEQTKVKYTHSGDTLRNPFEINLENNNEIQDCKIGSVGATCGRGEGE
jgi:hypothetical protein